MYFILLAIIYIAFISLGLPDSVLGAAWPSMYRTLGVSEGAAGIITMLIYTGTMISSMASDKIIRKLGTGNVMVLSVALTAITMPTLFGLIVNHFSISLMPCFALLFTLIFILLMRNIKRTIV